MFCQIPWTNRRETAVAERTDALILKAFRTDVVGLITLKSLARPHLKHCPITLIRTCKFD